MDTKKLINEDIHYIEDLKKAKSLLDTDLKKAEDSNKYQQDEITKIEIEIQEKEKEVSAKGKELDKLEKRIQMLEKEKEKYGK
jgi:DNA repair ATPase RecN